MFSLDNLNQKEKQIYKAIITSNNKLKKDIMTELNLPKTTANRLLQSLINKNLIKEIGTDKSTGGRPPIIYGSKEDSFYIIGMDLARSYSEVIILNSSLKIIFNHKITMTEASTPESVINYLSSKIKEALNQLYINEDKILGMGIGTVGPVNIKTGILGNVTNFKNNSWSGADIKSLVSKHFSFPLFIGNGANMAALGEFHFNYNPLVQKVAYVNLGLGIRYGLVVNGKIIKNPNSKEDAFGHMTIKYDGDSCPCGNNGCLELYATIGGIEKIYKKYSNKDISLDLIVQNIKDEFKYTEADLSNTKFIEHMINYSEKTNNFSFKALNEGIRILSLGLNNFSNLINTDRIVINGPLIQLDYIIYNLLCYHLKNIHNNGSVDSIYTTEGYFKENIISTGAAFTMLLNKLQL